MKSIFVLSTILALTLADHNRFHPQKDGDAVIVRYGSENIGTDGYNYGYETSNHIVHQESGRLLNAGTDDEELSVQGEYSYPGPDGVNYVVQYIADRNGFRPIGKHLPKQN